MRSGMSIGGRPSAIMTIRHDSSIPNPIGMRSSTNAMNETKRMVITAQASRVSGCPVAASDGQASQVMPTRSIRNNAIAAPETGTAR